MSISSSTLGGGRTKYKIIFLGDQSVGKSSIIERYIKDKFDDGVNPTVGIDFHIKNVSRSGKQYRIQLWDTAGQERFRSLIPNYMKDANCAIMVYDITKKQTLGNLKIWNDMFEEHRSLEAIKVCVGNKIDLSQKREVSKKEGEIEAAKYNSKHFEVSAKQGKRMDELFNNIIDLITEHIEEKAKLPVIEDNQKEQNRRQGGGHQSLKPITLESLSNNKIKQQSLKKQNCC